MINTVCFLHHCYVCSLLPSVNTELFYLHLNNSHVNLLTEVVLQQLNQTGNAEWHDLIRLDSVAM